MGGPPTLENLCEYCRGHNAYTARQVFGEAFIAEKRAARAKRQKPRTEESPPKPDVFDKVQLALCKLGFRQRDVSLVIANLRREQVAPEPEPLLRAALNRLTPAPERSGIAP
jgi:Holliday junction resolvasome RuvABC DNA-binding subunit